MNLLQEHRNPGNHIRNGNATEIMIGNTRYTRSLLLTPDSIDEQWGPDHVDALATTDIEQILAAAPELVLLGTGRQRAIFRSPQQQQWLQMFPGMEVMDTASACRTYNLLQSEGRRVVAGLILDNPTPRHSESNQPHH